MTSDAAVLGEPTVSTAEAARRLGCTRHHVGWLLRKRRLVGVMLGRDWRVSVASLDGFRLPRKRKAKP